MLFPFNIYSVLNLESDVCMNGIPSFKAAYPTTENVNVKQNGNQEHPVVSSSPEYSEPQQRSSHVPLILSSIACLIALGVSAKTGVLGSRIQKLVGGNPKISQNKFKEKVNTKLSEYLTRTGGEDFNTVVLKNGNVKKSRTLGNGLEEVIVFNRTTGLPDSLVHLKRGKDKKTLEYVSYKGTDILDDGFDYTNNFFKKLTNGKAKRKHIFGEKQKTTQITYGEMAKEDTPVKITRKTALYRDGSVKSITEKKSSSPLTVIKDFLYGQDGKVKGFDIISSDSKLHRKLNGSPAIEITTPNRVSKAMDKVKDFFGFSSRNSLG